MKKYFQFSATQSLFFISILVSFPLIFRNAIIHVFPMGYTGLFTQMANQIADANFLLPAESPFYGPGGIPFAYPPFGLYLLAFFIKLTGKYYFFLRWLPPVFSLISIALIFLLSLKFFKSPVIAAFTAILAATSTDLYIAHTWSSGIVRAPAFIFTLLTIYFFSRNAEERSTKHILLMGLFFGLSILSHLAYALFGFVWLIFFSVVDRNRLRILRDTLLSILLGLLLSSIWIVPVGFRHGWSVFLSAFNSHGGENLFSFPINISGLGRLFLLNLAPITSNIVLTILFLFGMYYFFQKKRYNLIFFFLLIAIIFPENARFVFWLGCFFAACGLWLVSNWIYNIVPWREKFSADFGRLILSAPILIFLWWTGYSAISSFTPFLSESAIELGELAPDIFPPESKYLALLIQDEAEWMPFLLKREPLVAQWGSEWLGEYGRQIYLMSLIQGCRKEKDWPCVETALDQVGERPQFIITYRIEKKLNDQISVTGQWDDIYSNNRYIVWQAVSSP